MFHSGTRRDRDRVLADCGRVPGITAFGPDLGGARERACAAVDRIDRPGGF